MNTQTEIIVNIILNMAFIITIVFGGVAVGKQTLAINNLKSEVEDVEYDLYSLRVERCLYITEYPCVTAGCQEHD